MNGCHTVYIRIAGRSYKWETVGMKCLYWSLREENFDLTVSEYTLGVDTEENTVSNLLCFAYILRNLTHPNYKGLVI